MDIETLVALFRLLSALLRLVRPLAIAALVRHPDGVTLLLPLPSATLTLTLRPDRR